MSAFIPSLLLILLAIQTKKHHAEISVETAILCLPRINFSELRIITNGGLYVVTNIISGLSHESLKTTSLLQLQSHVDDVACELHHRKFRVAWFATVGWMARTGAASWFNRRCHKARDTDRLKATHLFLEQSLPQRGESLIEYWLRNE